MILLLGGTGEARRLAGRLHDVGVPVVSSLAGDVAELRLPVGEVRIGGFGGVPGLVDYLGAARIDGVIDATHPFAAGITANAAAACQAVGTPLLRLSRPGWSGRPDAGDWSWVEDLSQARQVAGSLGRRLFLTTGRQGIGQFLEWSDRYVLVRAVDPPTLELPGSWELLLARGPFSVEAEQELMTSRGIEVLVTKDSGGSATVTKLDAAAHVGVRVVIVRRPKLPAGVEVVDSIDAALRWALAP
ncbi:MAG: cobalt-precorrin-6A reductase [Propionicimonas sp.]